MQMLKIGMAGLGRLGIKHAENIAFRIPGAQLSAVCARTPASLARAQRQLGVERAYLDYREMLQDPEVDAVAISSPSVEHCRQIEAALDAGKHVFVEKPLGVTVEECLRAEAAVARNPNLVFFLAFMRRYDPSYAYAMEKIRQGEIGEPYLFKGTGQDPRARVQDMLAYTGSSGGIFLDLGVHDMDLMRWFLGEDPEEVYAVGGSYAYKKFAEMGDAEAACAVFKFPGGKMAMLHCGRAAPHGYHIETEITGTEGAIRISPVPQRNLALLYKHEGVLTECVENFPERFEEAYRLEMQEFVDCVLQGRKPGVVVQDGTRATQIAFAAKEAFMTGKPVRIRY